MTRECVQYRAPLVPFVSRRYGHGALDAETRDGLLATCNMSDIGPLMKATSAARLHEASGRPVDMGARGALGFVANAGGRGVSAGKSCDEWQNDAHDSLGNIDIYVRPEQGTVATIDGYRSNPRLFTRMSTSLNC